MGIRGLKTYLDADPRRFSSTWRWNFAEHDNHKTDENDKGDEVFLLVDGMSMLYHMALMMDSENSATTVTSPATVADRTTTYIRNLLEALGSRGFLHIFMDGLAPKEKIPSQLRRLQDQAIHGDLIGVAVDEVTMTDGARSPALLHLLAEWAFVEFTTQHQVMVTNIIYSCTDHRMVKQKLAFTTGLWIIKGAALSFCRMIQIFSSFRHALDSLPSRHSKFKCWITGPAYLERSIRANHY
jgi:hypothetical protein